MRRTWPIWTIAPVLLLGCASSNSEPAEIPTSDFLAAPHAPEAHLTVAMLRETERQRRFEAETSAEDELLQVLSPSRGDVLAFGGGVLGEVAGGLPGGAALGFSGHVAGGSNVGKAVGSTLGALIGAVLGPIGGIFGSVAGGLAGRQVEHAATDDDRQPGDPGPVYIDGIDTGPLAAVAAPDDTPRNPT